MSFDPPMSYYEPPCNEAVYLDDETTERIEQFVQEKEQIQAEDAQILDDLERQI